MLPPLKGTKNHRLVWVYRHRSPSTQKSQTLNEHSLAICLGAHSSKSCALPVYLKFIHDVTQYYATIVPKQCGQFLRPSLCVFSSNDLILRMERSGLQGQFLTACDSGDHHAHTGSRWGTNFLASVEHSLKNHHT